MRCSCGRWIAITSETCACSQNMSDYTHISDYSSICQKLNKSI